ncbi:MAG: RNA methyltransferase, partial [Actinobacteria bacterium]|nr:RNA methyltransferase [Actinomycetota bacterium]
MEGADLVAAGLAAGRRPQVVFVRAERAVELSARLGLNAEGGPAADGAHVAPPAVYSVAERVAEKISTLETPPDVMAVFPLPEPRALTTLPGTSGSSAADAPLGTAGEALVVYADGIGDPGNMGTLLRAAVAFGATAFATALGSADLYGPKTVRAGMGAIFGLPLFPEVRLADVVAALPGAAVYGLAAHEGVPLAAAALRRPAVLVVGAERPGLSPEALDHVTRLITIPLAPGLSGGV